MKQERSAALFIGAIFVFWRRTKPRKRRARVVSFDDAACTSPRAPGHPARFRGARFGSVNDSGTVMVLQYGIGRSAIIPRRAYPDGGTALWLLLQQQLIGSRSLQRRPDARIIVNTAAR